jgi:hypothetical protein
MKITLEFNLPEDVEDYRDCYRGSDYISVIQEIVEFLKREMDKSGNLIYEHIYDYIFDICREYGFSPWED